MLKVNEYGERQAKGNEKNLCFKGWETLVMLYDVTFIAPLCLDTILYVLMGPFFMASLS